MINYTIIIISDVSHVFSRTYCSPVGQVTHFDKSKFDRKGKRKFSLFFLWHEMTVLNSACRSKKVHESINP